MPHLLTGPSSSRSPLAVTIGLWMTHSARCVSEAADRIGMARSPLVPAAELSGRIWSGSRLGSGAEASSDVLAVILLDEGHAPVANARGGSRPRAGWWLSATGGRPRSSSGVSTRLVACRPRCDARCCRGPHGRFPNQIARWVDFKSRSHPASRRAGTWATHGTLLPCTSCTSAYSHSHTHRP